MHANAPFSFPMVENYDNRSSSFFAKLPATALPTPDEVRLRAIQDAGGLRFPDRVKGSRALQFRRPPMQYMVELGLVVKYGLDVSIAEAHCMLFVRDYFQGLADAAGEDGSVSARVPVPEVYGWRTDHRQTFIYMEYIIASPLSFHWSVLDAKDRHSIAGEIRAVVATLQSIPQSFVSSVPFIGHVNGGPLLDWTMVNSATPRAGPFANTAALHDWLASQCGTCPREALARRALLPDDAPVVLTHGNLHRSNILVRMSPEGARPFRLVALLDWAQAGWYPSCWEACKVHWGHKDQSTWPAELQLGAETDEAALGVWDVWTDFVLQRAM